MADKCLSERVQRLMTFVGGYIVLLPNGVTWYWGNMSVYVYSYFHHKNQGSGSSNHHQDMKAPWLLSMFVISMSSGIMVAGYVSSKIGRRPTLLLGVALTDGGLIASYFVIENSLTALDLTMGILCGLGSGFLHATILQTVIEWANKHLGLITAFLLTSYAIGSVVTNQIITHYLNPDNKKVDIVIGKTHLFSQEDILERVPSMFLALSTSSFLFHLTGFLLVRIKQMKTNSLVRSKEKKNNIFRTKHRRESAHLPKALSGSDPTVDKLGSIQVDSIYHYDSMTSEWLADEINKDDENDNDDRPRSVSFSDNHSLQITADDDDDYDDVEKSPSQVLRSRFFYVIWFMVLGSDSAFMGLSNYYKIFGQIWIKDDHFLTNLGTTLAVFTVATRLLWGILTDFMCIKSALVIFTSGLALLSTGYFFTASIHKWLFFVVTVVYRCINCGVYVNFIVAMHSQYGKANLIKNYGLLASATILLNIVFPPLTKVLLSHFGWFGLFFFIGFLNFCALVLVVFSLSD